MEQWTVENVPNGKDVKKPCCVSADVYISSRPGKASLYSCRSMQRTDQSAPPVSSLSNIHLAEKDFTSLHFWQDCREAREIEFT